MVQILEALRSIVSFRDIEVFVINFKMRKPNEIFPLQMNIGEFRMGNWTIARMMALIQRTISQRI